MSIKNKLNKIKSQADNKDVISQYFDGEQGVRAGIPKHVFMDYYHEDLGIVKSDIDYYACLLRDTIQFYSPIEISLSTAAKVYSDNIGFSYE